MELLKISSNSKPHALAGAIANSIRKSNSVQLQVIGAGSLNQAIKGIIIARGYLAPNGIDIIVVPSFVDLDVQNVKKTGIRLLIETRQL